MKFRGSVSMMVMPIAAVVLSLGAARGGREVSVKLTHFGEVEIHDGALAVMDGGIHGVAGHTIVIAPDGSARWVRRVGSVSPRGREGSGGFRLTEDEAARIERWRSAAWESSLDRRKNDSTEGPPMPPRWVWAVVMRRGDEVRVLEGGSRAPTTEAPEPVRELLEWMIQRVDELASKP